MPFPSVRSLRAITFCACAAASMLGADAASAQLRPLEPVAWHLLESGATATLRGGFGILHDQKLGLAGTSGRLLELGNFVATIRTGRVTFELAGTARRSFEDREVFRGPTGGADPGYGPDRSDSGDYRVATILDLLPPERDLAAFLRFGTRLPTTDDARGLDRDRTDFFATLGGRARHGALAGFAEAGIAINGSHDARIEQADLLTYALGGEYRAGRVTPSITLVGHADTFDGYSLPGNESMHELRTGIRLGGRWWAEALWVRGLTEFSPGNGVLLGMGWGIEGSGIRD